MPTGKPCFGNTIGLVGHQLWPNTPHSKCGFTPKFANPKRPTTRHTCMALVHGLLHYCKPLTTKGKVNRGMRRHGLLLRILQGSDDADDRKWKPFFNLKTNRQVSGLRRGQRNTKRRNNANHVHMLTTWGFLRFQGAKPPHFWSTLPHGWISLSLSCTRSSHPYIVYLNLCLGRTSGWLQMNRLSLRNNNRLKLETSGELITGHLRGIYRWNIPQMNKSKTGRRCRHVTNRLDLETLGT